MATRLFRVMIIAIHIVRAIIPSSLPVMLIVVVVPMIVIWSYLPMLTIIIWPSLIIGVPPISIRP